MAPVDRETVIVDRGRSSTGSIIIGLIVAIALIAIVYMVFFNNNGGGSGTVDVDVPAVSVDVVPDGQ
jgi:flagellar basal body-associated protein FliL